MCASNLGRHSENALVIVFSVRNVAVMRRKTDSWLNATQILKVAEFDKPHRTRILEREVQKGEHEKVQGGYGKYQGWYLLLLQILFLFFRCSYKCIWI